MTYIQGIDLLLALRRIDERKRKEFWKQIERDERINHEEREGHTPYTELGLSDTSVSHVNDVLYFPEDGQCGLVISVRETGKKL